MPSILVDESKVDNIRLFTMDEIINTVIPKEKYQNIGVRPYTGKFYDGTDAILKDVRAEVFFKDTFVYSGDKEINLDGKFTIAFWFKFDPKNLTDRLISNNYLIISFSDGSTLEVDLPKTTGTKSIYGFTEEDPSIDYIDTWHYICITRDSVNKVTVQMDGTTLTEDTNSSALNLSTDSYIFLGNNDTDIQSLGYTVIVDDLLISTEYENNLVDTVPTDYVINYILNPMNILVNHYRHILKLY